MTGYDADASLCEWGKGDMGRIFRLCYTHDKLQARRSRKNVRHHQRYRMKIAARFIRLKIRYLVDELHKCLSK
jgi:putative transposase